MKVYSERWLNKLYEKINKRREELAEEYNVSESSIVWIGRDHFIVCKNEQMIRV